MDGIDECVNEQRVAKLKRIRAGKKGSITKRIDQLLALIEARGSRTKIKYLLSSMLEVFNATKEVCNELTSLTVDPDQEWFEEVSMRVDTCAADVRDYIDSRRCDPASTSASMTNSWIEKHAPNMAIPYEQNGVEDVIANMTGLPLGDTIEQASVSRRPYYVQISLE